LTEITTDKRSAAEILAALPEDEREAYLSQLDPSVVASLKYSWEFWARPDQLPPEWDWETWLVLAGRGFGKSRMGAEWVRMKAREVPGCRIALIGETSADCRKVMIEGDSGILGISPPDFMPEYSPTNRQLTWPNGSIAITYNATEPGQLRGPQHHFAWADELAKWDYMQDSWDQLQFGMRLGDHPQTIVTTTPRPLPLIRELVAKDGKSVHVTKGATRDNSANLPESFIHGIEDKYGGTRLGRQELEGEILDDIPGALWSRETIDNYRLREVPEDLIRVFVSVDPAVSSHEGSDEHGIVVVGLARDKDGYARGYVLEDGSLKGQPEEWAKAAVRLYRKWEADKIIAEKNQGGEMVSSMIKTVDRTVPIKLVHATRGKMVRAEPISSLYEQGRVHHVGRFDKLEDQMCLFSIDQLRGGSYGSPDRVDALVWGLTEIFNKITSRPRKAPDEKAVQQKVVKINSMVEARARPTGWMV
jgi:phage terminase large subunit-like protein